MDESLRVSSGYPKTVDGSETFASHGGGQCTRSYDDMVTRNREDRTGKRDNRGYGEETTTEGTIELRKCGTKLREKFGAKEKNADTRRW